MLGCGDAPTYDAALQAATQPCVGLKKRAQPKLHSSADGPVQPPEAHCREYSTEERNLQGETRKKIRRYQKSTEETMTWEKHRSGGQRLDGKGI